MKPMLASPIALPGRMTEDAERRPAVDLPALLTRDLGLTITVALTLCLSALSVAYFFHLSLLNDYGDGKARLLIARSVLEGRHAGLGQLGGIWPPFPQVYMLPLIWSDALYQTGLAGAIPSALSYVVASAFLYRLVSRLTRDQVAALVAVIAFSGPNVLYLQSVPMSELPFLACFVAAVYFTVTWLSDGSLGALFLAGLAACTGTLTRYEGWVLVALLMATIAVACWRGGHRYGETEGHLVFFGLVAFFGIGLWLVWNRVIFGDALYFLHSQYGTKATNATQLQGMASVTRPVGNLRLAVEVSAWMVVGNIGWITTGVALLGLVRLALPRRSVPAAAAALLLLFPIAFSIAATYAGAEVVADPHAMPGQPPTNLRYGLLMAPAAGFLAGWLAQGPWRQWPVLAACVASSLLIWHSGPVNVRDATTVGNQQGQTSTQAGDWLRGHYDGGLVLTQRRTNENLLFTSQVSLGRVVYEGDRSEWSADLSDPAREIRWIVMNAGRPAQATPPDQVWKSLHGQPRLLSDYELAYENGPIQVYRRRGA